MRLKNILNGISALGLTIALLILTMLIPIPTQVYAEAGSTTTILKITIPDTHSVHLMIGEHGTVSINGEVYRGNAEISLSRLARQEYNVQAEEGWQITSVLYASEEQKQTSEKRTQFTFTAPAINEDGHQLVVTLEEDKSSDDDAKDTDTKDTDTKDTDTKDTNTKDTDTKDKNTKDTDTKDKNTKDTDTKDPNTGVAKKKPQSLSNKRNSSVYQSNTAKTGDTSNLLLYGMLIVLASGAIVVLKRKRRKV